MKYFFLRYGCVFIIMASTNRLASQHTVKGIISENRKGVEAVVQLLLSKDSSLIKSEISNENGYFQFHDLKPTFYLVQVNAAGYTKYISTKINVTSDINLDTVKLERNIVGLEEVAVVTRTPFIERDKGKVTLNVESSVNASGSSVYEIIEKAPGVRTDNNDNISLNGKPGTSIWIDGKPTPMTGTDLANYLRGIPSTSVEKIELIANPPARYDAAGTSIINIIMKKDKKIGTNGSISVSYGQGVYPKTNNSISLNHRDKKVNVFGSYSYSKRLAFSHLQLTREFSERDSFVGAYVQDNYFKYDFNTHVVRTGADYYINKKNTIGFVVSGVNTKMLVRGNNASNVFNGIYDQTSIFNTLSNNSNNWANMTGNINFKHDFDSLGTSLTTDLDYARYDNKNSQNIETRYFDNVSNELQSPYLLTGGLNGDLKIYAIKNDLSSSSANGFKFEAGQKSSYVIADNDLSFYNVSAGTRSYDSTKSNHFIYRENINAAYITVSKDYKKWSFQTGLRFEYTLVNGMQLVNNTSFSRDYMQLFPSAVFTYKIKSKHDLEFDYSRRIRRPSYDQLNPFKFYLDPTTYKEGNPYLQPSITESFEFSHIYDNRITTSLGFGRTFHNIIETIAPSPDEERLTVQTNRNLDMVDVFTFNSSIPVTITKWWQTTTSFNIYQAQYTGRIANTPLNKVGNITASFNSINSFNLSSSMSAEITAEYQAREVYAYDIIEPIWFVNIGVQKKFLKNKATIRANFNDVFFTNKISANVHYTGYHEKFLVTRDTRVVTVSFSYKFGKNSVPGARRRQGAAEELNERARNGMG